MHGQMNESCLWPKVWRSAPMGILMRFYPSLPLSSGNPHLFIYWTLCSVKLTRHFYIDGRSTVRCWHFVVVYFRQVLQSHFILDTNQRHLIQLPRKVATLHNRQPAPPIAFQPTMLICQHRAHQLHLSLSEGRTVPSYLPLPIFSGRPAPSFSLPFCFYLCFFSFF